MAGEANMPDEAQAEQPAPKTKSKMLPIVLGAVVFLMLVSSAYAVATFVVPHGGKKAPAAKTEAKAQPAEGEAAHEAPAHETAQAKEKEEHGAEGGEGHGEAAGEGGRSDRYRYSIPSTVVNLSGDKLLRFAKIGIVLDCASTKPKLEIEPLFERHKIDIQDCLISILGAKTVDDISEPYGKVRIKEEIGKAMNKIVFGDKGPDRVENVFFSEFLVQ